MTRSGQPGSPNSAVVAMRRSRGARRSTPPGAAASRAGPPPAARRAEVAADALVEVLRLGAVVAQQPHLVRERRVVGRDAARASPNAPRFLLGKNEKQPAVPDRPGRAGPCRWRRSPAPRPRSRQRRALARDRQDRVHVGALAVEMDGHDRAASAASAPRGSRPDRGCRSRDRCRRRPASRRGARRSRPSRRTSRCW